MKNFVLMGVYSVIVTNVVASDQKLLSSCAIFRVGLVQSDVIGYEDGFYQDEALVSYIGRPVSARVTLDRYATPALRVLVGFVGSDGAKYTCKPLPELKKGEVFVIWSKFCEDTKSFLLRKEKQNYCCCCTAGRELVHFERGYAEPEIK